MSISTISPPPNTHLVLSADADGLVGLLHVGADQVIPALAVQLLATLHQLLLLLALLSEVFCDTLNTSVLQKFRKKIFYLFTKATKYDKLQKYESFH
jgi:Na+/pantothenate symporter